MSIVYYKFKSEKAYATATFDGMGISVFDLKREIMLNKKLGKGTDFDLVLYNAHSNEVYNDDKFEIPRNTEILVSRTPPSGKFGTAQRYLTSAAPTAPAAVRGRPAMTSMTSMPNRQAAAKQTEQMAQFEGLSEEDKIKAMLKQNAEWVDTNLDKQVALYDSYSSAKGNVPNRGGFRGGFRGATNPSYRANMNMDPNAVPHPGYVCYRCLKTDHFIHNCPTIGNPDYDGPKLKRTTGIPKTFLRVVDEKSADGNVMMAQSGELVVVQPNSDAWDKYAKRSKSYAQTELNDASIPDEFKCTLCSKMMNDAVMVPCCGKSIRHSLLDNQDPTMRFRCPSCKADQFPDNLVTNTALRQKLNAFIRDASRKEASPAPGDATPSMSRSPSVADKSATASPKLASKSVSPHASTEAPSDIPPATQVKRSASDLSHPPPVRPMMFPMGMMPLFPMGMMPMGRMPMMPMGMMPMPDTRHIKKAKKS